MVTRRNTGRANGHAGNGDDASETTPETDNSVLQRILRRMDQLQEQNQTLQEQNQTLQTQVTTLAKGRAEEDIPEGDTRELHPFSMEIAETPYPLTSGSLL
ncbi:K channel [Sesbania bispinosa]|nr:K channel [Sesbania bispinosa]